VKLSAWSIQLIPKKRLYNFSIVGRHSEHHGQQTAEVHECGLDEVVLDVERAIDVIAITDHNHSANIAAVQQAAQGSHLTVLPGMELQTKEEVHILCLFDTLDQVYALQQVVDAHMPGIKNNPEFFGEQFVVDASGDFIRREEQLLLISCDLTMKEAFELVTG